MLKIIIITISQFLLVASDISESLIEKRINESFITKYEYGKMLYNNPREISCAKCHGDKGKGILLSTFKHKTKDAQFICEIKTEDISKIAFDRFSAKLDSEIELERPKFNKSQVCEKLIYGNTMPKYFLTNHELESIYYYITNIK